MKILSNNRGAVMVMAAFVAVLLAGVLYHVLDVGDACLEQQIMQDAADATVFSAATVNARGMNILALINLIMLALLTILVALRLVQALLTVLMAAAAVLCAIPFTSAACAFVEPINELRRGVDEAADGYQEAAKGIIKGLHNASDLINEAVPLIALAEGINISTQKPYSPPATAGFVFPIFDGLPTKNGTYGKLCERAGNNVAWPIKQILPDGLDFFGDAVGELLGELTQTFSSYFCGDDGEGGTPDRPKKKELRKDVGYPPGIGQKNHSMLNCASESSGSHPDGHSGKCYSHKCRTCAQTGCTFCLKAMMNDSDYKRGLWTIVENHWVEWRTPDAAGITIVKTPANSGVLDRWSLLTDVKGDPCDEYDHQSCAGYDHLWEWTEKDNDPDRVPKKDEYFPRPICEQIEDEAVTEESDIYDYLEKTGNLKLLQTGRVPTMTLKKQTLFVALSSCVIEETIKVEPQGNPMVGSDDDKDDLSPRVLDTSRFPDEATMTGIVIGEAGPRFSFAQAQYYSMNKDRESMWHMKWLSRLVRVKLSDDDSTDTPVGQEQQNNNKDGMDMLDTALKSIPFGNGVNIDDYILH